MKSLITWFVRNPIAANLIMAAMFVVGVAGYFSLEREFIPQININGITITVSWPGASPRDVEEQLIVRIEEAVEGLGGIDFIEATGREGQATVEITTKLRIDYEKLLDEVQSRVDAIQNLPVDSFRPQVMRRELRSESMFLALYGDEDPLVLQREANKIRQDLSKLGGLQLTEQISKRSEQVTIEISETALRQYGLTFSQVAQEISGSSVNLSAGTVRTTGGNLQLRARSLANSEAEFDEIIIRQTASGGIIRLRDIATVIDGFDDSKFAAQFRGQNTAIFKISSPDNPDITLAGKNVRQFEKDVKDRLPPNMDFAVWFDQSTMFDGRMSLIGTNAISGMILVLIILILFLRPIVALWVTVGIAAAFAGAIAIAPHIGITLNMISLFAFLLVIGIVVDDAIVVGESIYLHTENGFSGERSAVGGANMVVKPVFFAVITTIMMFVPFMLMTGPIRAMTAQISLVVIAVLTFSLIEAFFILPVHLRHLKPVEPEKHNRFMRFQHNIAESLVRFAKKRFRPFVAMLIKFRYITVSIFVGLLIMSLTFLKVGIAPTSFIPEVEGDLISFSVHFPEGTTFERKEQVRANVEQAIVTLNENTQADFGVDYALITEPGTITDGNQVRGFFGLTDADKRKSISTKDIADRLEFYVGEIPDAHRVRYGYTEGGFSSGGLRYGVASANDEDLKAAVLDLKSGIESYAAVTAVWDGLESSASEIQFTLKPGAATLGITLNDVTRQVREAFYGREVQRLPRGGEDVRVMVRYPETARNSIDSLEDLRIRAENGVEVPLFSVADVSFSEGTSRIKRRDRKRVTNTGGRVRGEKSEVARIKKDMLANFIPDWEARHPNVTRIEVGDDEVERNFIKELQISMVAILFMMYALLAIAFKSYAQPLLIMIAIPFALVGMIFGNIITGVPFGMMSLFGFFAASGVAINDNLVLIDYVNRLRSRGIGAYQAMLDACVSRFRPILLTSVTTFVGITPILFETSTQAEFLKPMVVALAFGVLFDFFLTLMLVPAMYGIGVDITRIFRGFWRGEKQPGLGSSYDPELALALDDFDMDVENPRQFTGPKAAPAE